MDVGMFGNQPDLNLLGGGVELTLRKGRHLFFVYRCVLGEHIHAFYKHDLHF